jgi:hypothetical protein
MEKIKLSKLIEKLPERLQADADAYIKGLINMTDADIEAMLQSLIYGDGSAAWDVTKRNVAASVLLKQHEAYVEALEDQVEAAGALKDSQYHTMLRLVRLGIGLVRVGEYIY